jgi:hypothetical protein
LVKIKKFWVHCIKWVEVNSKKPPQMQGLSLF